jgi:hypothetical protein
VNGLLGHEWLNVEMRCRHVMYVLFVVGDIFIFCNFRRKRKEVVRRLSGEVNRFVCDIAH